MPIVCVLLSVNPCSGNLCSNGGTCIYSLEEDIYHCVCADGHKGPSCELGKSNTGKYFVEMKPCQAEFILGNVRTYLHEVPRINHEMIQVVETYFLKDNGLFCYNVMAACNAMATADQGNINSHNNSVTVAVSERFNSLRSLPWGHFY